MRFVRPRQVWLPTIWGWLVLLFAGAVLGLVVARNLHDFLAPDDPAPSASVLVVEGWLPDRELDQAVAAFRAGRYSRVITTGGPAGYWMRRNGKATYAELAADYLRANGLAGVDVVAVPAPESAQDRTYLSAVVVRDWMQQHGGVADALNLFSGGTHARRSRNLYQLAFGAKARVGVLSANPSDYDALRWWRSSAGAKSVVSEVISLTWTLCCFFPPPPGSHEEKWAVPEMVR